MFFFFRLIRKIDIEEEHIVQDGDVQGSFQAFDDHLDGFQSVPMVDVVFLRGFDKTIFHIPCSGEIIAFFDQDLAVFFFDGQGDHAAFDFDVLAGIDGIVEYVGK